MEMRRYRQLFLDEAREHLTRMGQLLIVLEQSPDERAPLEELFRQSHSLKSMASAMGYVAMARLAHHLEEVLAQWRDSATMPAGAPEHLLAGVDLLELLLDDLAAERPERDITGFFETLRELSPAVQRAPEKQTQLTYQVSIELAADTVAPAARALLLLRDLQTQGEVLNATPSAKMLRQGVPFACLQAWLRTSLDQPGMEARLRACSDVAQVRFLDDRRSGKEQARLGQAERTVRVRIALLDQVIRRSGELLACHQEAQRAAQARDWGPLDTSLLETARQLDGLHQELQQSRLLPLESITGRLPRLVRDLARATGKQVAFHLGGGKILLDREILDELAESLVHLVRNAVDHGIVPGVPGTVTVTGRLEQDQVLIEVGDNGRGLDAAALKRQALDKGFLSAGQVAGLSEEEVLRLICLPGFSTAPAITEVSGYGVGLDAVKTTVEKFNGTLEIVSAPGAGCQVQMRFPSSPVITSRSELQALSSGHSMTAAGMGQEVGHALS